MELRAVRAFVAVADAGSVTAAAVTLHLTQPAVSRLIQALERELGLALFDRVDRRGRLARITVSAPPTTLRDVVAPFLATWGPDDPRFGLTGVPLTCDGRPVVVHAAAALTELADRLAGFCAERYSTLS